MKNLKTYKQLFENKNEIDKNEIDKSEMVIEIPEDILNPKSTNSFSDDREDIEIGDKVLAQYHQNGTYAFEVVPFVPTEEIDKTIIDEDTDQPKYLFDIGNADDISVYCLGDSMHVINLNTFLSEYDKLSNELFDIFKPILTDEEIEEIKYKRKVIDFNL